MDSAACPRGGDLSGPVCRTAELMWPALEPGDADNVLLQPVSILAPAATLDADLDADLDGDSGHWSSGSDGSSSRHSRKSSESSDWPWLEHAVKPSEDFPPIGLNPMFNIWSPSNEDTPILLELSCPASHPSLSEAEHDCSPSSNSPPQDAFGSSNAFPSWESDFHDWVNFDSWSPVPSPAEASALRDIEKQEEEFVHIRAAIKRAIKKDRFFSRLHFNT